MQWTHLPTYLLVNSELTVEWFSHHTVQTTPPACREVQYTSRAVNETLMGPQPRHGAVYELYTFKISKQMLP